MTEYKDLLLELGCEELPAREQPVLQEAGAVLMGQLLDGAGIRFGTIHPYVAPRRIAFWVENVALHTISREEIRRGPTMERAFSGGQPTAAAMGFARSCGVDIDALEPMETEKGPLLVWRRSLAPASTTQFLPGIASRLIGGLPLRKRMRWADREESFSRPLRWLLLRFGTDILPWQEYGLLAEGHSFGHRVHHPGPVTFAHPRDYVESLRKAHVVASWQERRTAIAESIGKMAEELDSRPVLPDILLDEITGLNEWPVALAGGFDSSYLTIPEEVLVTVMVQHQRYIPLKSRAGGELMPRYAFVANISSRDPLTVIQGNNRVLRARLADAAFFWDQDRRSSLESRLAGLDGILFQEGLGTIADKVRRLVFLAPQLASSFGCDRNLLERSAQLCKADLLSGMVGEFPELQGIMGGHYARNDREEEGVVTAIAQHYRPATREDPIPDSPAAQALAVADRIDTLFGFFALGKFPSGDRDPYALRRAALGILRTALEGGLHLSITALVQSAGQAYAGVFAPQQEEAAKSRLTDFFTERLRVLFREEGFSADQVHAVLTADADDPLDARSRLENLAQFLSRHEAASSLAAVIRRISNILRKEELDGRNPVRESDLTDPAEIRLWNEWQAIRPAVRKFLGEGKHGAALDLLAGLESTVDQFFAEVLVLSDDMRLRNNRLALLHDLQSVFASIADFSALQGR